MKTPSKKTPPFAFRSALRSRGHALMKRWQALVDHFGDGDHRTAETIYPRLQSYRKRAMRIAMKLRAA